MFGWKSKMSVIGAVVLATSAWGQPQDPGTEKPRPPGASAVDEKPEAPQPPPTPRGGGGFGGSFGGGGARTGGGFGGGGAFGGGGGVMTSPRAQAEFERARAGAAEANARFFTLQGKREKAAFMGVSTSPVTAALREQLKLPKGVGMVVDFVEPKSPAEEAGIKQYDVLHKLDDQLLVNAHQLAVLVRMHKPGEEVALTLIRQGEPKQVKVKLTEKEVMALDDQSPWGVPPNPFGAAREFDFRTFKPVQIDIGKAPDLGLEKPRMTVRRSAEGEAMRTLSEDGLTLTIKQDKSGRRLTIIDSNGVVQFNGPIDTPEQREAVPSVYRDKLKKLESATAPRPPSTQPLRYVPGFGQPNVIRLQREGEGGVEDLELQYVPFDLHAEPADIQ